MNEVVTLPCYTPEDLLRIPDGDRYELVNGRLVEHTMSTWASYVAGKVYGRLDAHCQANQLGWVLPEGVTYRCFPDAPDKVRKADVSFIRRERLSMEQATAEGHLTIVPDLAVEVLSPNDLVYEVDTKVQEYLRAGVRLVWVIHPQGRWVDVHRVQGPGTILRENDDLDGEDVLPGFRCRVGDLFQPPPGVAPSNRAGSVPSNP
ncbi:MAG TPA: Uma2 family endonuclease [Gemmataceae bacterium]|nr:Uma2 family endonuclease [Gemmataceae bacterium]